MKPLLFLLFACSVLIAQTKPVHNKYGTLVSETYMMRLGIYVTVVHDDAEATRGLRISPSTQPGYLLARQSDQAIAYEVLTKIIDELVPLNQRGKFLRGGAQNANCLDLGVDTPPCESNGDIFAYENVTIFFSRGATKDQKRYAEARWNKPAGVD